MTKLQTALTAHSFSLCKSTFVLFFFFVVVAHAANENATHSENIVKERPIVIHTQAQHYDQPTLSDYTKCHENLDSCLAVCATADDPAACTKECPTCPRLLESELMVQGVNDTEFKPAPQTPFNTTNVIRLTNEIRNIISNKHVDIHKVDTNNKSSESTSRNGGKYGMGFNEQGSCCILVNRTRNCHHNRPVAHERCHRRRQRICGERCKARVVYARSTTPRESVAKCHYMTQWPFVACGHKSPVHHCQQCLSMPYGIILQHGIPPHCMSCFEPQGTRGYGPYADPYRLYDSYGPPPYYREVYRPPVRRYPRYDYDDYYDSQDDRTDDDYWKTEETKCRNKDGSISHNCPENSENDKEDLGSGDDAPYVIDSKPHRTTADPLNWQPEAEDEDDDYANGSYEVYPDDKTNSLGVEAVRKRRGGFLRSAYSLRYGDKN